MSIEDFRTLAGVSPILSDERVSKALTDWFRENIAFTHWEYVGSAGKGDAYLSELIRIKIHGIKDDGTKKHVQLILKTMPSNICRRLTYRSDEFFRNEINFYKICLPALLEFQSTKKVNDPFTQYAKLFYSYCDGKNDVLSLEDVSVQNYGSAVRQEGIDLDHCKMIFKSLAQFHALSFAMKDQKPEEFEKIGRAVFETYYDERLWDWYTRFWKRISGIATDAVEKEYPNTVYVDKIKEFAVPERYQDMINAATKTYETGVISHGDCWTNNFLFKYVDGKPVDAKLIDFQLTRCATPVLDISFVICACTTQEMRSKYYDELLKYYHDILSKQIREMGSDPVKVYAWDTFMEEIKNYSFFGLAFSFESTPMIIMEPGDTEIDMEKFMGNEKMNIDDFWPLEPIKTKKGRLRVADNVVFSVDRGYI